MDTAEIRSFIRGFHVYKAVWTPVIGEELVLQCETCNPVAPDVAVAVIKDIATVVGHVPANLAPIVRSFLSRTTHSGTVVITGRQVNRGAGFGLEIPCVYRLHGGQRYVDRLNSLVQDLTAKSLL